MKATIAANGGTWEGRSMADCADIIDYWEQLDIYEYKIKHPVPRMRVIPFAEWMEL